MIRVSDMSFAYGKGRQVFDHLSFDLHEGRIYGLLGLNGAGKTTLLNLMSGLLFPVSGSVSVNGMEAKERRVEMLSQLFYVTDGVLLPATWLWRFVDYYAPFYPNFSKDTLTDCLEAFGQDGDLKLSELSLGQKQKFSISFALATQPKILLMDEPTNGLDIPSKSTFRKLLMQHMADDQLVVISTHQVHDVAQLLDEVVVMGEDGTLRDMTVTGTGEQYAFGVEPSAEGALYAEPCAEGYRTIRHNETGGESKVDLELLFNALTQHKL